MFSLTKRALLAAILFVSFLIAVAFDVQSGHNGPVFLNALFVLLYGCPHLHMPSIRYIIKEPLALIDSI